MAVFHFLFLLFIHISITRAGSEFFFNDSTFDEGAYGPYPVREYKSSNIQSPRPNILQWDRECENGQYVFLAPRGGRVAEPSALILDSKGDLIWSKGGYGQVYNLMMQEYQGAQYITFWAGDDTVGGHGAGYYYMLDSSYKEVHKFTAANGLDGDLHEFRITPEGTALITVYETIAADLTAFGPPYGISDGKMWDCLIQELDLATGEVVFQWRASEHHSLTETQREIPNADPFDFYHINSIDKDLKGNFLVSSRYLFALTYISGATGETIWQLGGKKNSFTDLSEGKATAFIYQHDARWVDDYSSITLFDNGAEDGHFVEPYTRGLRILLDQEHMTAELVNEYVNPHHIYGWSQGSLQTLGSGNILMGYGNSGAMTEYFRNGTVLCDVHFGPEAWFGSGDIQSYRIFKFDWVGRPSSRPDISFVTDEAGNSTSVYVSWNGDTEVKRWALDGCDDVESDAWSTLFDRERNGFETEIVIQSKPPRYVRVRGIDDAGSVLGETEPWNLKRKEIWKPSPLRLYLSPKSWLLTLIGSIGFVGVIACIRECWVAWRKRRLGFRILKNYP